MGIFEKIAKGMTEHAKKQQEITKARHEAYVVTPADAREMFLAELNHAKLSPAEKQELELAKIKEQNKSHH